MVPNRRLPAAGRRRQAAILAEVEDAKARLEADEDDLEAIHIVTYHALLNRDLDNAMKYVDQARALDPDSAELHVHLAILQLAVGMHDRAETELDLVTGPLRSMDAPLKAQARAVLGTPSPLAKG